MFEDPDKAVDANPLNIGDIIMKELPSKVVVNEKEEENVNPKIYRIGKKICFSDKLTNWNCDWRVNSPDYCLHFEQANLRESWR